MSFAPSGTAQGINVASVQTGSKITLMMRANVQGEGTNGAYIIIGNHNSDERAYWGWNGSGVAKLMWFIRGGPNWTMTSGFSPLAGFRTQALSYDYGTLQTAPKWWSRGTTGATAPVPLTKTGSSTGLPADNAVPCNVNKTSGGQFGASGKYVEMAMWQNRAMDDAELQRIILLGPKSSPRDLYFWFRWTKNSLVDLSGNGRNCTIVGSPSYLARDDGPVFDLEM